MAGGSDDAVEGAASLRVVNLGVHQLLSVRTKEKEKNKAKKGRTASRMTTKLPITFALAKMVSVAALNTSTHAPCAVGILALKSGKPFATLAAAIMR